jgi:hypothetical protein
MGSPRDTSRATITFPNLDYTGSGTIAGTFEACVFSGPTWSGFSKPETEITCSADTEDVWGNLIRTFRSGTMVDLGTLNFMIDWDIENTTGGDAYGAFMSTPGGDFIFTLPPEGGETSGPIITIPGIITNFTPQGEVISEGENSRLLADITLKISGALSFTAPA